MLRKLIRFVSLALLVTGCSAGGDDYYDGTGTLVVDWTVDGTKDPRACRDFGADAVSIVLRTRGGSFIDELQPLCERFSTAVDLSPGSYRVDVVLLDPAGVEITTTVYASALVYDYETTFSAFDFPFDSFL
jgi:hypothetical protein